MMPNQSQFDELKEYIKDTLGAQLSYLTKETEDQGRMLRQIEITTTTRQAEMQKDIQQLSQKVREVEEAQKDNLKSQKFRWTKWEDRLKAEQEKQETKEQEQIKIFERFNTVIKLLWTAISLFAVFIAGLLWQIFINGGVHNIP
jgi:hypothetical protein